MLHHNRLAMTVWLLMVLSSASLAEAQTNVWTSHGPEGGNVTTLAIDPLTPTTLYAGTVYGGVFKSIDGGGTWTAVNTGLPASAYVWIVVIDPLNPTTLYAGTAYDGVFKSTDGGANWSRVNLNYTSVRALAVDPLTPTTLYAGTTDGGVLKSTDGGASWSAVNTGLPHTVGYYVGVIAIDPLTPSTLYTVIDRVYKSTDGGASWSAMNTGLNFAVFALSIDPLTPSTLYAGTNGGVYKSTDGGESWSAANTGLTKTLDSLVSALAIDPLMPSTLYAGIFDPGGTVGSVFKSTDAGQTWSAVSTGLTNAYINALAMDPLTPSTLYAGAGTLSYQTLGALGGVFKSTDGGGSWAPANAGLTNTYVNALAIDPLTPSTLYAGLLGSVFKSTDGGGSWGPVNTGLTDTTVHALAIDPRTPTTLYAGTGLFLEGGSVFKSIDGGGTWTAVNAGLPNRPVYAVVINPLNPSTLYAATYTGIFKSTNGGESWGMVKIPTIYSLSGTIYSLAIDPLTPTTIYAGTDPFGAGVLKSTNGGGSWAAANTGLPASQNVDALVIDPLTPTTLYAAMLSSSGASSLYKSTNGGGSWNWLDSYGPWALAIDPLTPSNLYAGTFSLSATGRPNGGAGVVNSSDGGDTWGPLNTGLTNHQVQALAVNPLVPSILYAGTYGGGVFALTRPFDYALSNSGAITLTPAKSGSNTITATLPGGVSQSVSFSAAGLPTGATAAFSPAACTPTCSTHLTISTSSATPPGTFAIAVTGAPLSRTTTFNLVVVGPPDLAVKAVTNPPAAAQRWGSFAVIDTVLNQGTGSAGFSTTRYYLSADTQAGAGDVRLLGGRYVGRLGPGAASTGTARVWIPGTIPTGKYFLIACADDGKVVTEAVETNNCRASTTQVTIGP